MQGCVVCAVRYHAVLCWVMMHFFSSALRFTAACVACAIALAKGPLSSRSPAPLHTLLPVFLFLQQSGPGIAYHLVLLWQMDTSLWTAHLLPNQALPAAPIWWTSMLSEVPVCCCVFCVGLTLYPCPTQSRCRKCACATPLHTSTHSPTRPPTHMHTKVMPPTSMQKLMLVPGRNEADNSLY